MVVPAGLQVADFRFKTEHVFDQLIVTLLKVLRLKIPVLIFRLRLLALVNHNQSLLVYVRFLKLFPLVLRQIFLLLNFLGLHKKPVGAASRHTLLQQDLDVHWLSLSQHIIGGSHEVILGLGGFDLELDLAVGNIRDLQFLLVAVVVGPVLQVEMQLLLGIYLDQSRACRGWHIGNFVNYAFCK